MSAKPNSIPFQNVELSSLDSPNWIKDEVIDQYLELITKQYTDFFSFSINFFTCLKKEGYESVKEWYEGNSLFKYKMLFFPVYDRSHYYLVVYDNIHQKMEVYDPYDFGFNNKELQAKLRTENESYFEASLSLLIDNYLKPIYEAFYEGILFEAKLITHTPPEIPSQVNDSDCGVYLLQFAKHLVQNKQFNFNSEHIDGFREEMKLELFLKNLRPVRYIEKNGMKSTEEEFSKPRKLRSSAQRRFFNKSLEDCWMNSTLQLILTGMDHLQSCADHGSILWNALIFLKNEDKGKPLNPLLVKEVVVTKENQRICAEQLIPNLRLQYGQQDAKDFLICLKQNQFHWPDVFNTFKVKMNSISECRSCGHKSSPGSSNDFMFLEFSCPDSGTNMSSFLTRKLENPEIVPEWRDEEGCGQRSGAFLYNKIVNIEESEFLIVVLKRLVDYGDGPMILRNKVPLGEEFQMSDLQNQSSKFRP